MTHKQLVEKMGKSQLTHLGKNFQQQSHSHGRVQKQGSLLCIFYFCLFDRFERCEPLDKHR